MEFPKRWNKSYFMYIYIVLDYHKKRKKKNILIHGNKRLTLFGFDPVTPIGFSKSSNP